MEKWVGEKWSLQSQGKTGMTELSHFFRGMLALLGNNSAGMESVFGKERVHGRMYYIGDKRMDVGL